MLSQISSYVSRIATKRKQLSASKFPAAKNESTPRGKNDNMRSSEESHSHPLENEEPVNCVKRKGRKEELSSPRMTTLKAVSKKYDMSISEKRKNVVSLIELCSCKALDNVVYKRTPAHY